MPVQQPPKNQEVVCADMSSSHGSVTIAVKPEAGVIVTERVCLTSGRVTSGVRLVHNTNARKPPTRTYAVIRSRSAVSLERESENDPRTRHLAANAPPMFGKPRIGFTKLKPR